MDAFTKNIIIVFAGTACVNFFNLLFQLLIAHKLSAVEFGAFNSLISVYLIITAPLATVQIAVAKYSAEFNALRQINKLNSFIADFFKRTSILAFSTLLIFGIAANFIVSALKINSLAGGYILAALLAVAWLGPVFSGAVQGMELFGWMTCGSVISSALKLGLAFVFVLLGYSIAGALGALLVSNLIGMLIFYFPLRRFISVEATKEDINYKEIIVYLFPVAISSFCYMNLISLDMVLVKYFFLPQDSGIYAIAQMVGKIFLFLPGAISIVMFPKTCGLNAKKISTYSTLQRSLLYAAVLCSVAVLGYNLFPRFTLEVLTGKAFPESIVLGRLFSVTMSFFALVYIFISYFLSIKDFRFLKYLAIFTLLQFFAVIVFHKSLLQVQVILCINSILLFFIHLLLANKKNLVLNRQ